MSTLAKTLFCAAAFLVAGAASAAEPAFGERPLLPQWQDWERYAVIERGSVIEELYAPKGVMRHVADTGRFAYLSRLVLVEYESDASAPDGRGAVRRYIVMQKEKGWGASYPKHLRNGEWEYRAYHGDGRPFTEAEDSVSRCLACHRSAASSDYVYSLEALADYARSRKAP